MAMTHDYLEYLDEQIGISPAGSQEELQAAQTIADLMKRHDVDPEIEEFDARSLSKLGPAVLLALLFVGAFCLAIGSGAVTVIGLLLVAATMQVGVDGHVRAVAAAGLEGNDTLSCHGCCRHFEAYVNGARRLRGDNLCRGYDRCVFLVHDRIAGNGIDESSGHDS